MSFFVRPHIAATNVDARVYLDGSFTRPSGAPCVYGVEATPADLLDNDGKGCDCRIEAMVVSNEPAAYALFTQARGLPGFLSYSPDADTLGFSKMIGASETFEVNLYDATTGSRTLFNRHHNVYLTVCTDDEGRVCIRGAAAADETTQFIFDSCLGSGPLMLGCSYFIKTIYGTTMSASGANLLQVPNTGSASEEFTVERGLRGKNTSPKSITYQFRSSEGTYISMDEYGLVGMRATPDATCSFEVWADATVFGNYRMMQTDLLCSVRAEADTNRFTYGALHDAKACDAFGFQSVEAGPVSLRLGSSARRTTPFWPCVCPAHEAKRMKESTLTQYVAGRSLKVRSYGRFAGRPAASPAALKETAEHQARVAKIFSSPEYLARVRAHEEAKARDARDPPTAEALRRMVNKAKAEQAKVEARRAPAGTHAVPIDPLATAPACARPAAAALVPPPKTIRYGPTAYSALPTEEDIEMVVGKGGAGEPAAAAAAAGAAVVGRWTAVAKRGALVAMIAAFLFVALFVAQLIAVHYGGHLPLPWF